jgi:ribosomal protein S18 acetylase RimI-like enzyme
VVSSGEQASCERPRHVVADACERARACARAPGAGATIERVNIRPAQPADLPRVAALAAHLVRMHHEQDADRFFLPDDVERGYAWWFSRELPRDGAVILVAEEGDAIVGYAYGTLEERDWNMLLATHGAIHDIYVDEGARRAGTGKKLVDAIVEALEKKGAPRIVLATMVQNERAQRVFRACGFRPTMLEMTRTREG